ncbi:MAG: hypothetical protein RMY16_16530 [Nostoc sp. DedQUE12b]|uniref:hypothetical protein n=1 Tax=Nostoc sp. DedQUE12b TaxID=3075398 RepID=UPI002AD3DEFF|nr:hypothetical protein [Nostoc sp. DedQUE12b]MDZ8087142.1 hypothetical protein [Nostoc sp. DedQUE12b]
MSDLTLAINLALHPTTLFLAHPALFKLPGTPIWRTLHPSPRAKWFETGFHLTAEA